MNRIDDGANVPNDEMGWEAFDLAMWEKETDGPLSRSQRCSDGRKRQMYSPRLSSRRTRTAEKSSMSPLPLRGVC